MPRLLTAPTRLQAHGTPPKVIEEFVGRVNSATPEISIARMTSPAGWSEPFQQPEFNEYTLVLRGAVRVETLDGDYSVEAGQAIIVSAGERVRYSTPGPEGAEYIAVCLPAFFAEAVHRDSDASR